MTKSEYIANFVTIFIATYTAKRYQEFISLGMYSALENPPIEDAQHLAEKTWDKFYKTVYVEPYAPAIVEEGGQ